MKKLILRTILTLFIIIGGINIAAAQNYVRKKVQPNFFIPKGELAQEKAEKLSMPKYRAGKSTAKHISADENREAEMTAARQRRFQPQQSQPTKSQPQKESRQIEEAPTPTITPSADVQTAQIPIKTAPATTNAKGDEVPDYQQKYQEYLQDLKAIAKTGNVTKNPGVDEDLSAMSSEKRIAVDKQFNEKRDVKSEVDKLLK